MILGRQPQKSRRWAFPPVLQRTAGDRTATWSYPKVFDVITRSGQLKDDGTSRSARNGRKTGAAGAAESDFSAPCRKLLKEAGQGLAACLYAGAFRHEIAPRTQAQVAQLVEQRIENPRVAGSIPALGTIFKLYHVTKNRSGCAPALALCDLQKKARREGRASERVRE